MTRNSGKITRITKKRSSIGDKLFSDNGDTNGPKWNGHYANDEYAHP